MKIAVKVLSIFLLFFGIALLIYPLPIYDWVFQNSEASFFRMGAILGRFGFGILLILAAKESRFPSLIKVLGYLMVMAAVIFIFIGQIGFQNMITSVMETFRPYARVGGITSLLFGGFLYYSFMKNHK